MRQVAKASLTICGLVAFLEIEVVNAWAKIWVSMALLSPWVVFSGVTPSAMQTQWREEATASWLSGLWVDVHVSVEVMRLV